MREVMYQLLMMLRLLSKYSMDKVFGQMVQYQKMGNILLKFHYRMRNLSVLHLLERA